MVYVVIEKKNGIKHLLYVSGINMFTYCFSIFVSHVCQMFFMSLIISLGIYIIGSLIQIILL